MQVTASTQNENKTGNRKDVKRLTWTVYSDAGILGAYDWSVKEREAHDKIMENYRRYLMKLSGRSTLAAEIVPIEKVLISNYVRLCIAEGIKPRDAYKELEKRLEAVKELRDSKML